MIGRAEITGAHRRSDSRPPQNLIRHPIPDAGKDALQQQNSFNQSASRLLTELALRQKRAAEESARLELQLRRLEQLLVPDAAIEAIEAIEAAPEVDSGSPRSGAG